MEELLKLIKVLLETKIQEIIIAVFIIIVAILINKYIVTYCFKILNKIVKSTNTFIDDNIINAIQNPFKLFVLFLGIYYSLKLINIDGIGIWEISANKFARISIVVIVCYFIYNLTLENSILYSRMHKKDKSNTVLFPFVSIVIRLVIIIIAVSIISRELGFTGFIAGLGISGVAFALMAQDAFSNLFGGAIIVLDRPFAIGDWIQTSEVEGIVEEITFRSTKIRTFSMALATIPNSKLANNNIINWTQRNLRRIHFKFTIDYSTNVEKIESSVEEIENVIRNNEKIDDKLIIVSFNELSTYGFGIFVYFYTTELNYVKYEKLKQEINIEILKILKEEDIKLVFLNFNLRSFEERGGDILDSSELESINSITEEERGK